MGETHREKSIFHTSEQTHPNIWICYPELYIRMKKFNSSTEKKKKKHSVVSNSLEPHACHFLCPWDFFQARILEWVATSTESFVNSKGLCDNFKPKLPEMNLTEILLICAYGTECMRTKKVNFLTVCKFIFLPF